MFDVLKGEVVEIGDRRITLMVNNIGFSLNVPVGDLYQSRQEVTIFTHLHWNQEQGPSLFGFATKAERDVFIMILDCSGIGPKIALAVLADLGVERFIVSVQDGCEKELCSVNGIGAKKAEQMIVQLRHKVAKFIKSGIQPISGKTFTQWQEVVQVLESLNYSKTEISDTVKYLRDIHGGESKSFDQLMRNALSHLAKRA